MKLSKFVKFTNFDDINHVGFWISHTVWDFSHLAPLPERLDVCLWAKPFALPKSAFLPSKPCHPHCHSGWWLIPTCSLWRTGWRCSRSDSLFQLQTPCFGPTANLIWLKIKKKISVAYFLSHFTLFEFYNLNFWTTVSCKKEEKLTFG